MSSHILLLVSVINLANLYISVINCFLRVFSPNISLRFIFGFGSWGGLVIIRFFIMVYTNLSSLVEPSTLIMASSVQALLPEVGFSKAFLWSWPLDFGLVAYGQIGFLVSSSRYSINRFTSFLPLLTTGLLAISTWQVCDT